MKSLCELRISSGIRATYKPNDASALCVWCVNNDVQLNASSYLYVINYASKFLFLLDSYIRLTKWMTSFYLLHTLREKCFKRYTYRFVCGYSRSINYSYWRCFHSTEPVLRLSLLYAVFSLLRRVHPRSAPFEEMNMKWKLIGCKCTSIS